jgi:hypothetical protein
MKLSKLKLLSQIRDPWRYAVELLSLTGGQLNRALRFVAQSIQFGRSMLAARFSCYLLSPRTGYGIVGWGGLWG